MLFARINDIVMGVCVCAYPPYPDIGVITSGDTVHIDSGMPVARVSDIVTFSCGTGVIISGTPTDISTSLMVARTGDQVTGCGQGVITSTSLHITM